MQIMQMVAGIGINVYVLTANGSGVACLTKNSHVYLALLLYGSFFLLFAKYFHGAYVRQKKERKLD